MLEEKSQLCFTCARSCGGCSWSRELIPVPGWTAVRTLDARGRPYSYAVSACPEYVREGSRWRDLDEPGCTRLLEAMVRQMRDDYRRGPVKERQAIRRFLRSDRGRKMLQLSDVEKVIEGLDALVRMSRS